MEENTTSSVSSVRKFVSRVHWPSRRQVAKRGCHPYVEFNIRGKTYRAHFVPTSDMKTKRPYSVYVTAQGTSVQISSTTPNEKPLQVGKVFVAYEDTFTFLNDT